MRFGLRRDAMAPFTSSSSVNGLPASRSDWSVAATASAAAWRGRPTNWVSTRKASLASWASWPRAPGAPPPEFRF
ncbi:MAG: hypothetical protein HY721_20085 [Planctomycetes bacterium]|nr:hypothetical protein [Planctomycetota bacterium]